jgi:threonyl-tRNA synthetase
MKETREVILSLKDQETLTTEQFWDKLKVILEPKVEKELEKLRREGEFYFPKTDVITRIC